MNLPTDLLDLVRGWFQLTRICPRPRVRLHQVRRLSLESMEARVVFSVSTPVALGSETILATASSAATLTATSLAPSASSPLVKSAPPPAAPTGRVIRVATEADLQNAIGQLQSNSTILIAPGVYNLTNTLNVHDVSNVTIRGATNNRDDVVLVGRGMTNPNFANVPHGILLTNVQDALIANLTIRSVRYHSVSMNAGTESPHLYNLHLVNAGEQFVKSNPDDRGGGVDGGIVEYCTIEYSVNAPTDYTNGVDVHAGRGWFVRNNLFRNIRAPQGQLAGPAVLFWNGSSAAVTEGNLFQNVQRGIQYGLDAARPYDNVGGIIRNNFIYRSASQSGDVGIGVYNSRNTQVLHNTVILSGTYANAIEFRFAGSTGIQIRNNLSDAALQSRDGAVATLSGNITNAKSAWFVNAAAADLHLSPLAIPAINKVSVLPYANRDYDGQVRPQGSAADIGADEFS